MAESDAAYDVLPPKPPGTSMESDKEPRWIWGLGTPNGDLEPWDDANKGSFYSQVDATDDRPHVWMKVDEGNDNADWVEVATMPLQFVTTDASGWSYNLIDVTNAGSSANLRGLRVNARSAASATVGDIQCIHGNLVLGATTTVAANGSLAGLQSWVDITDSTTFSGASVVSGLRVIVDPNNNAMGSAAAGVESALIYAQTWASTGTIDSGLFIAAGAGSTIDSAIELGSGTFGRIIDLTSWGANTLCPIIVGGPKDTTGTAHWQMAVGDSGDAASILAELGGTSYGSVYFSTTGEIWYNKAGTWTQVGDAA